MITRENLYDLVWSKPMTKVAEQFEVSGSYMARVCAVLNVPRPERGYWAKLAVGKAPARMPLPEATPGDQLSWSRDGALGPASEPRLPPLTERPTPVRLPKHAVHGLIRGARQHFETGYPVNKEGDYQKPYKKLMVDVTASKACLDKALEFANDLFNALETAGHRVLLAPPNEDLRRAAIDEREARTKKREHCDHRHPRLWSPHRPTVVYIGTVPIGLAVVEMSETVLMRYVGGKYIRDADYKAPKASRHHVDHTWTTMQGVPSGRLRLVAYAAYPRVSRGRPIGRRQARRRSRRAYRPSSRPSRALQPASSRSLRRPTGRRRSSAFGGRPSRRGGGGTRTGGKSSSRSRRAETSSGKLSSNGLARWT